MAKLPFTNGHGMDRNQSIELRDFLVDFYFRPGPALVAAAAERFSMERASVRYHIRKLCQNGLLSAVGNTKARRYTLPSETMVQTEVDVTASLDDDYFWRQYIKPALESMGASPRVMSICSYGSTEMLNNVIDHSETGICRLLIERDARNVTITIRDFGVGIFERIRADCDLVDRRQALLELSKGKLTSNPRKHSGEGIFFTSRAFDRFALNSLDLSFFRRRDGENWLFETRDSAEDVKGTEVIMEVKHETNVILADVFKRFEDDQHKFMRTHVPVQLAKLGEDELVSRSQAKRLMARVEKFSEVLLDFSGVSQIGQAFADEVFRVWVQSHPETTVLELNASPEVRRMIARAQGHSSS